MATVSCLSLSFVAFRDQLAFGAFLGRHEVSLKQEFKVRFGDEKIMVMEKKSF